MAVLNLPQAFWYGAGHLFYKVGLTPCNLATASAPLGATVTISFAVYDEGSPQLKSTVNRTLQVVSPCPAGTLHVCMLTFDILLAFTHSLTVSCIHSFAHSPIRVFIPSFLPSFIHSFIHSCCGHYP